MGNTDIDISCNLDELYLKTCNMFQRGYSFGL